MTKPRLSSQRNIEDLTARSAATPTDATPQATPNLPGANAVTNRKATAGALPAVAAFDTPRTDSVAAECECMVEMVRADFARQLERELAAKNATPQPSTAMVSSAPSGPGEGVGQGGAAEAACDD